MTLTVQQIAEAVGGTVTGDVQLEVTGPAEIKDARSGQITFLANSRYEKFLDFTEASVLVVSEKQTAIPGKTLICVKDPYYAFMQIVRLFHPEELLIDPGVHPAAVIDAAAQVHPSANIGAHAVVGRQAVVGPHTTLMPGVIVGAHARIGANCLIHARVSIRERVEIGNRVIIHDGSVIGSDGFGFAPHQGVFHKIPQVGIVMIEDDVEVGANVTIDRAALGVTRIRRGSKLDNLIQIAHNCEVGEDTVIAAQAGISGSTKIGNHVQIGGQAGFAGHIEVGDGAAIAAQSGVSKTVPPGQKMYFGTPAGPAKEEFRLHAMIKRLPEIIKEIKWIKSKLDALEGRSYPND